MTKIPLAFDLVITDMTMPTLTGDRLAKALLAIRPDIPVILCTGYSERITGETVAAMGIRGVCHETGGHEGYRQADPPGA